MRGREVVVFWRQWGWVVVFCLVTSFVFFQSMKEKNTALMESSFRLSEMAKEKRVALAEKEELALKIASQGDPAWIEMVLMRDLGLVPEGWLKVHFKNS